MNVSASTYTLKQTFDNEVLPLLRRKKGFIGELMLANPGSLERITTSL